MALLTLHQMPGHIFKRLLLVFIGTQVVASEQGLAAQRPATLTFQDQFRIVSSDRSVDLRRNTRFALGEDGRVFLAPTYTEGTVAVFGPTGGFERVIGRRGEGPGELNLVLGVDVFPDSVVAVADASQRISFFSATGEYLGSFTAPTTAPLLTLRAIGSEELALGAWAPPLPSAQNSVFSISREGEVQAQFGIGARDGGMSIAPARSGLWVGGEGGLVRLYSSLGQIASTVDLGEIWRNSGMAQEMGDMSGVLDLREDEDGVLWVIGVARIPQPELPTGLSPAEREARMAAGVPRSITEGLAQDTHVLFVRSADGDVRSYLPSAKAYMRSLLPDRRLVILEEDGLGLITARFVRMSLGP